MNGPNRQANRWKYCALDLSKTLLGSSDWNEVTRGANEDTGDIYLHWHLFTIFFYIILQFLEVSKGQNSYLHCERLFC